MSQLGSAPPWAVLQNMIDKADSDRNGKVIQIYWYIYENLLDMHLLVGNHSYLKS